jgi:hypothetical protein
MDKKVPVLFLKTNHQQSQNLSMAVSIKGRMYIRSRTQVLIKLSDDWWTMSRLGIIVQVLSWEAGIK